MGWERSGYVLFGPAVRVELSYYLRLMHVMVVCAQSFILYIGC